MEQKKTGNPYFMSDDEGPDVKRYISLFISNWYWFAAALFLALTAAYGINRYSEKVYTISSTLLIKDDQYGGGISDMESIIPGGDIFKSRQNLKNEIGILKSFSLNYKVISALNDFHINYVAVGRRNIAETKMYRNCPFIVIPDTAAFQSPARVIIEITSAEEYILKIEGEDPVEQTLKFGQRYNDKGYNFRIEWRFPDKKKLKPNASNKYYFYFENPHNLANSYRSKLNIQPIEEEASLVNLSVSGNVPGQEADYLNKLMELYISQGLEFKNQTADSTIVFIENQLNIISDSLKLAEKKLEDFRLTNQFIDLSSEGSIIQNRLVVLQNEKSQIDFQLRYYNYLSDYINSRNESGSIVSPSLAGINDPALTLLVNELGRLQMQKRSLNFNLNNDIEAVRLINSNIENAKIALKDNIQNSINNLNQSSLENDRRTALVKSDFLSLPGTERKLINIQREFDLNNTVYTYLLNKRAEAGIAKASTVSVNRIIDRAEALNAGMIKPRSKRNYITAIILGLFAPMVLILLIDYLNNKVIDKKDVERLTDVPVIGYISHNDFKTEIPVREKPGSTLAESFRSIRTALKYLLKDNGHSIIAITSTISAEGKTFISINLATIFAMMGKRVLLVGLDLRKPRIQKVLSVDNCTGMSDYLSGKTEFDGIIKPTEIENLFYVPSGPVPPNPAELIESDLMKSCLLKAREEFDFVILDTPPIAIVTDALLITSLVDVNVVVVRQRFTSKNTLNLIEDLYTEKKLRNPGIIINDISLSGYYGYGLRYGYSMGYGYSYGFNYYGKYGYRNYGYGKKGVEYYND